MNKILLQMLQYKVISALKALLIGAFLFNLCSCALFIDSNYLNRKYVKEARKMQKKLKQKTGMDLTFPYNSFWLKDSCFILTNELIANDWVEHYIYKHDSVHKKAKEEGFDFKDFFRRDDPLKEELLKHQDTYLELIRCAVPIGSSWLIPDIISWKPVVFVDSASVTLFFNSLKEFVDEEILHYEDSRWHRYFDKSLQIDYEFLTLEDYLVALERWHKIKPQLVVTDSMPSNLEQPFYLDTRKRRAFRKIDGLMDNASELVLYDNRLYVVYKVTEEHLYISRFVKPDYHIGFRLKERLSKRNPVQK